MVLKRKVKSWRESITLEKIASGADIAAAGSIESSKL